MFKYNFKEFTKEYVDKSFFSADALILQNINKGLTVLEIGCASGYMSKYMKEVLGCKITGVDYSKEAGENAMKFQERTYIGDLDDENFLYSISGKFDIIILPAVLEHLKYPEKVLIHIIGLLSEGGKIIISLPNVAHYSIRFGLLFGMFNYQSYGILDNTHLKLYTYKTSKELIRKSGLKLDKFICSFPFPFASILIKIPLLNKLVFLLINKLLFRFFGEELIFICSKK